ncbi:D-amino acid aminotransferase [Eoetvoesiella caeni]|uniref:branched-chain-amino-acid transaminase n=1 Tax=Eoetvoesiella caeni TaxID=645616 RepID=A0A366HGD0_9BURK|nr:D-amino acid aminotransferase [Eoetvoesiella caeni]MCI2807744.1 D-amino acid aminotransferase [Eoetvoesiella caeni]NYT54251.1 D-amino acid aminotransferase [Eoetvoesiella caeni]RBP41659.1 D-alanine transaminase [Eoetvoesiella caeni]
MIPDVDNDSIAYLNGEFVRLGDAKISVLDRGFIFGDSIYDVVPVYNGKPFRMEGHLARLERSLKSIGIQTGMQRAQWESLVRDMLARNTLPGNCLVYLQVTRGVAKRDHAFPDKAKVKPTIFGMVSPFVRPGKAPREQGLTAISLPDIRWLRCEIKTTSLLGNVLAKQAAVEAGVDEVVQFRDGYLSEGSSCNIWVVKNGTLLAPPRDNLILEGVRYSLLAELAEEAGIPFEVRPITEQEVAQADEIMLTSASKEVLPIVTYNGKPVGTGRPGEIYARLRTGYDRAVE